VARLAIFNGNALVREIDVPEGTLRVGRNDQNDVVLIDPGKAVSRFHAELRIERGACTIVDLNSQNGTWVAGRRVAQATLMPGQAAVLGTHRLVFNSDASVGEAEGPSVVRAHTGATAVLPGVEAEAPPTSPGAVTADAVAAGAPAGAAAQSDAKATPVPVRERPAARVLPASSLAVKPRVRVRRALTLLAGSLCVAAAGVAGGMFWWPASDSTPGPPARAAEAPAQPVLGGPPTETAGAEKNAPTDASTAAAAPGAVVPTTPAAAPPPGGGTIERTGSRAADSARPTTPTPALRGGASLVGRKTAGSKSAEVDTAVLIERARAAVRRGDYPRALGFLQPVMRVDAGNPEALELLAAVRSQGHDAFTRGRQLDGAGRTAEAIVLYEKAAKLLPPDHPSVLAARQRLAVLRPQ
jgi:predicted component of type VI protein secretion system